MTPYAYPPYPTSNLNEQFSRLRELLYSDDEYDIDSMHSRMHDVSRLLNELSNEDQAAALGYVDGHLQHLLRELAQEPPSEEAWQKICNLFEYFKTTEGLTEAVAWADAALAHWDDGLRILPRRWTYECNLEDIRLSLGRVLESDYDIWFDFDWTRIASISHLVLYDIPPDNYFETVNHPQMARIRHLDVEESSFDESVWTTSNFRLYAGDLARSPHVHGLTSLVLNFAYDDEPSGDHVAHTLAQAPHLTGLTKLSILNTHITDTGAETLARADNMKRLRYLNLNAGERFDATTFTDIGLETIRDGLPNLETFIDPGHSAHQETGSA